VQLADDACATLSHARQPPAPPAAQRLVLLYAHSCVGIATVDIALKTLKESRMFTLSATEPRAASGSARNEQRGEPKKE
jgi:hypothetical protein